MNTLVVCVLSLYLVVVSATVYTKGPSDYCSFLQGGNAKGGDVIELTPGVYDRY